MRPPVCGLRTPLLTGLVRMTSQAPADGVAPQNSPAAPARGLASPGCGRLCFGVKRPSPPSFPPALRSLLGVCARGGDGCRTVWPVLTSCLGFPSPCPGPWNSLLSLVVVQERNMHISSFFLLGECIT